jgi:hypothetical protein
MPYIFAIPQSQLFNPDFNNDILPRIEKGIELRQLSKHNCAIIAKAW